MNPLFAALLCVSAMNLAAETRPVVIAHRGASGYLPEHTLVAKAAAHAMGADFIEQDLVLTKDDVPIVLHDVQLETVCDVATKFPGRQRADGHFYALDFTLAEIKQLRAHERISAKTGLAAFPKRFPLDRSTFEIPTLEEELQLIQGMNVSTGRVAGIYPEIKQPRWHRQEGHDISSIVLPILRRYGYATKADACWVQCFEWEEVRRIRGELEWKGRLVFLLGSGRKDPDGSEADRFFTPAGLAEVAGVADGIGPALGAIATGKTPSERKLTTLVRDAHAANLAVHPYTARADELPKWAASLSDLHAIIFREANADGVFTDFPDATVRWLTGGK